MFNYESLLLKELFHIYHETFSSDRFNLLVELQHFGFPTRLLDTTTNPLVTLYFACADQKEISNDGKVFVFPNIAASWPDDPLMELVLNFVFEYSPQKVYLEEMLKLSKMKYQKVHNMLTPENIRSLLSYLTINAFPVIPLKINKRISAQNGTFFIFGMNNTSKEVRKNSGMMGRKYYNFSLGRLDENAYFQKTILVPSKCKEKILKELDILSINKYKLFPDLSNQGEYIVERIKNQYNL